jgi:TRAP-type C4-dicarboxylate transport system substrate-binding protein
MSTNFSNYIATKPKKSDFRYFIVNVMKGAALVHSGVIHHSRNDDLSQAVREVISEAMTKSGIKNLTNVEHVRATFDSFFDTEIDYDFPEEEYPPFKGSRIRYKTKGMKKPWNHLDDSWEFHFTEKFAENLYLEAYEDYIERQKELTEAFKQNLFKTHQLLKHPKREALWEKVVKKFPLDRPNSFDEIWKYTSDVYSLMI